MKDRLKKENINLEYVKFTDYNQPNAALADGSIDLNSFQHQFFLDNYNKEHGTDLVSIGNTVNAPLGIYSNTLKDVADIKDGAKVAIPNDVTNGGRALLLLQTAGLIKVDKAKGQAPTVSDITENRKNLDISELDASQTARALSDVDISVINSGVAVDAGFNPASDAIFLEPVDDHARPYVNIIVARKEDEKIKRIKNSRRLSNRRHSQSNRENIKRIKRACMGNIREKIRKMTSIGGIFMTTTISTNQLKDLIQYRLPEYQALALDIHEHPEVSNYEFYSSAALIKQLEKEGFWVEKK